MGRTPSDAASLAESVAAALGFSRSDTSNVAETVAAAWGFSRTDTATLSESALTQLGRPASDTATIAESIAAALGFNPTDAPSLAESLAAVLGLPRSDSAALGESATAVLGFARTETPGLAESIAAALGFSPSDTTTLAESADAALGFSRSDTTTLVDSAATAFGFPRSDTATLAESIATQLGRTPSDAASLAESVAAALGFSRSDTSNVAETDAAAWGFSRTDTATLAESIETQSGRAASNAASIADSVAAALGFNPTDTPSLAESIAVAVGFSRTDTTTLAESIKTLLGRPASDAATLAESLAAALGFSRSDTPILAEATVAALGFSRSDTASLVESVLTQRGRPLSDTLALGESLAAALGFSRSDAASVGEASVAAVSFLRSDTASFQEFVVSLFGKPVSESASIGESLATALGFSRTDTANLGELGTAALGFSRSDGASLAESILSVLGVSPSEASDLAESLIASLGFSRSDKSGLLASFTLGFSRPEAAGVLDAMMLGFPRADEAILADTVKFVVVPAEADLEVAKGVSSDPALAGTILTYTVIVSNNGPKHASGVIVTDILPDNVSFDSASASQGTCTEALGIVTCDLGKIDKDGIAAVTIDIIPSLDAIGTTITGTASVTSAVNDPTSGNNSVGQDTAVVAGADLSVTKSDSPDPVLVGDPLAYTVTVANNGPAEATGVVLTDTLPADVTFGSASPTQGTCTEASGTVTCELGTIASGAGVTVTIAVTPKEAAGGTSIANTASATAQVSDPDVSNNSASQTTTVNTESEADLAVTKSDSPDPVLAGATLTYTLAVTNNGPADAPNVVLTDTLPANVTVSLIQGNCSPASGTVTCALGTIVSGASSTVAIIVTPSGAAGGTIITNTASVSSGLTDPISSNNSVSQSTTVNAQADLQVTKTDAPDPVPVGESLVYSFVVTNNGPSSAKAVELTDTLPANVTFESATASQGSCSEASGVVTCDLGTISNGASVTASITVTTTAAAGGTTITDTASVTSTVSDPDGTNNSASQSTAVTKLANLEVIKEDPPNGVISGKSLTYKVTVTNKGLSNATGVTLTDTLPAGVTFVSATPSQGSCAQASGTITCNLGAIVKNAEVTATIVVTVQVAVAVGQTASITNSVIVQGAEDDPDEANNAAAAFTTVYYDDDGDGIGDNVEAAAPNGGDGDNDGVPDKDQDNVASFLDAIEEEYATLVSEPGTKLTNVEAIKDLPDPDNAPDNAFPKGLFGFEVEQLAPAASTTVELLFPTGTIIVSYWKYGPTPGTPADHWYEFLYDGTTGAQISGTKVTLHFVDGLRGDDDLIADGVIVDQGAPVLAPADLSVTKTDSPDPASVGSTLTYIVTVSNSGPSAANAVVLTDTLPASVTFATAEPSQGSCSQASGVVTCDLGTINNGANATVTITVTPKEAAGGTTITNTASVTATQDDTDTTNNSASQNTVVGEKIDLTVKLTDSPDPVLVGNILTYVVTVTNNGPSQATAVVMTGTLPSNVTFGAATPSQGSCSEASGTLTCNLGALDNGAVAAVIINATPTVATGGTTITNTATEADSNTINNSISQNTAVNPQADLSVTKTDSPDPVDVGKTVTYTVTVTNKGPSQATAVVLTDTLPANATFSAAVPSQGICNQASGTVTCNLGSINSGASATVTITAKPTIAAGGTTISNSATVTSGVTDPDDGNNVANQSTTVGSILLADISVTKSDAPDPVQAGNTVI